MPVPQSTSTSARVSCPEDRTGSVLRATPAVRLAERGGVGARTMSWGGWPRPVGQLVLGGLPVAALGIGLWSLSGSSLNDIGAYGLIQALHSGYFAALGILTVGFVAFLRQSGRPAWMGGTYVGTLTLLVDGAPLVVEGTSRFPVTYVHIGFVDAIMRSGHTLPLLDARFSWPGFFSLFGYLTEAAGVHDVMTLAVAFPLLIKALWLAGMWVVVRRLVPSTTTCWLGLWLFELIEWSGQSYFSPQALGMFVYLICVAVLVTALDPRHDAGPADRALLAVCIGSYAALVVTHQLSPFMVIAVAAALAVLRRTRATSLWALFVVIFVVWFSFGTTDYWIGHMHALFSDAGQVGNTIDSNVAGRVRGNAQHERVIYVRMAVSALCWVLAGLGVLLAWWRRVLDVRLVALGAAPVLTVAIQSYGGEGLIRVFLFVLPAASVAGALLFTLPQRPWSRTVGTVALTGLLLLLVPAAVVAKYGNESFEAVSRSELAAASWLHRHADAGDLVASVAPAGFVRDADVGEVDYVPALDRFQTGTLQSVRALMSEHDGRRFLLLSRSQYAYGTYVSGLPEGWQKQLLRDLSRSSDFRLVYRAGTTLVYELEEGHRAPASS